MNWLERAGIVAATICVGVVALRHADLALHASVPKDMPATAQFVQSGYDVSRNEAKGDWIACEQNADEGDDFCRVTDQRGVVMFQGGFLPVGTGVAVPAAALKLNAADPDRMWVRGPYEAGPVPVIPLENGEVLVPEMDREALASRWAKDPVELEQVLAGR